MTVCAVKSCRNHRAKHKNCPNVTFHHFPVDPVLAHRWTEIIRRTRPNESWWKPKPRTTVCSAHFRAQDLFITNKGYRRIRPGAVPTKALYISSIMSEDEDDEKQNLNNDDRKVLCVCDDHDPTENCIKRQESLEQNLSEPNTSSGTTIGTTELGQTNGEELEIHFPELESIFDTPKEAKLRKALEKKTKHQKKLARQVQILQQRLRRLKKSNASLKAVIKSLKNTD